MGHTHNTEKKEESRPHYVFTAVWFFSSATLGWLALQGEHTFGTRATLPALLALLICSTSLLWWIHSPVQDNSVDTTPTRHGLLVLVIIAVAGVLCALRIFLGPSLLFVLPVIGAGVIFFLRLQITRHQVWYALALAVVAGLAGLGAGWIAWTSLEVWAILQVLLVLTGLLAGWSILRLTGLQQIGVARSRLLTDGTTSALVSFIQGAVIAIPWALGNVVLGASNSEIWVQQWWQPLIAIQPGIAEEAWGRIMLVPLAFLVLRRFTGNRAAFTAALIIVAYWFAYLHTSASFDPFSTIMIGTLIVLPLSYLCLYRDLETAIGFHFFIDLVKFSGAYLMNTGLWYG